ncbi:unnamed protein product [Spirodela intermedia]|uniref:Uncharacterized protein n=2 Tax=Spirodela intermedia TaxID=51605 RepID=A0A7I8IG57_SPIIN|nr:unnamed protein product [Spirodela intermedia]CAA6656849.1 unnamed protein product [Spirodela intermedia]CAA7392795.1 unnamed protein product [Spirodela intermedia]
MFDSCCKKLKCKLPNSQQDNQKNER